MKMVDSWPEVSPPDGLSPKLSPPKTSLRICPIAVVTLANRKVSLPPPLLPGKVLSSLKEVVKKLEMSSMASTKA
jgi:hypothetical protein